MFTTTLPTRPRLGWSLFGLCLVLLAVPATAQMANVTIVTYNVQQLPDPWSTDEKYSDENGDPIDDLTRAELIATKIATTLPDIVVLNEVFREDARDRITQILDATGFYNFHVDKITVDTLHEDSGLMLFSRFPFLPMTLDEEHQLECGDVEIDNGGFLTDCPFDLVGYTQQPYDGSYSWDIANQPDAISDKGAAITRLLMPGGQSLFVVFAHFVSTYSKDDEAIRCAKEDDRRRMFEQVARMVEDAAEVPVGPPGSGAELFDRDNTQIVMVGDLNIDGNPFRNHSSACLQDSWNQSFNFFQALPSTFAACSDLDAGLCGPARLMVDAWGFDTSPDDLGRTNRMSFAFDLDDQSSTALATGKRIDYVLYRRQSPSVPTLHPDPMIPQHLTIRWDIAGNQGRFSDHLPVGVDLLLPPRRTTVLHTTPRIARNVLVPAQGDPPPESMAITAAGQMQWLKIDGPAGTYTLRATGPLAPGFDVYKPTDLSRPIRPREADARRGFEYLLDDPPYFVRTFAQNANGTHNRFVTGAYQFITHRHDCTSVEEACVLRVGGDGQAVEWPPVQVGDDDSMWFEFDADDGSPSRSPFHEFSVREQGAPTPVPAFDATVLDMSKQVPPTVTWTSVNTGPERWATRANGVLDNGSTDPMASVATYYLKLQRTDPNFLGPVTVSHTTNFTYFVPLGIRVRQENDDSKHDELMIFYDADGPALHTTIQPSNAHTFVNHFIDLPNIDEVEDGGGWWPAPEKLPFETYTTVMPLILLEDDDDCCGADEGDFLLTELALGALAEPGGMAIGALPRNETRRQEIWRWSDTSPLPSDENDTDYWYELEFVLTHEHPCESLALQGCPPPPTP